MVMQTKRENASKRTIATAPLEEAIGAAIESMWRAAEEADAKGRDDVYDAWQADVMGQRPILFVAAALPGELMAWLLDPSDAEGVLEAHIRYRYDLPDADGKLEHSDIPRVAQRESWTRLYESVTEDISWLIRERSGQHLREYGRGRPETD